MCGIVGVISSYQNGFSSAEQDMFRDMLFLDTLRGWDSTGVFLVENTGNVSMSKAAITGPEFIRTQEYTKLKSKGWSSGMFMVGHNRAATRGTINDANAHPFCVDDKIVLVQNGTYRGSHKHHKDVEVDTEAIAHVIADHENIEEALQKINAAYALVWYDVQKKKLHMIRNEDRPLWIAETKDGGHLFASEYETILYAASRAKMKLKGTVKSLEPGELHTFTIDGTQWEYEVGPLDHKFQSKHAPATTDWESEWEGWGSSRHYRGAVSYPVTRHDFIPPVDFNTVRQAVNTQYGQHDEKTLHDYVQGDKFNEYAVSNKEVSLLHEWLHTSKPSTIMVEFVDYLELSSDPKNRQWLVYGQRVRADNSEPSPLVYLRLSKLTEAEVMEFTSHCFYTVEPTAGMVTHKVKVNTPNVYSVVTLFCTKPIPVLTEVASLESH